MHSPVEGTTTSSNLVLPANYGPVAQLAERRFYTADVVRAIRTGTTNNAFLDGYVGRPGCNPGALTSPQG